MKYRIIIKKDGKMVTEVLERQGQECRNINRVTSGLGTFISDEETGPEGDTVHETLSS